MFQALGDVLGSARTSPLPGLAVVADLVVNKPLGLSPKGTSSSAPICTISTRLAWRAGARSLLLGHGASGCTANWRRPGGDHDDRVRHGAADCSTKAAITSPAVRPDLYKRQAFQRCVICERSYEGLLLTWRTVRTPGVDCRCVARHALRRLCASLMPAIAQWSSALRWLPRSTIVSDTGLSHCC
jgi:hypothetical protein